MDGQRLQCRGVHQGAAGRVCLDCAESRDPPSGISELIDIAFDQSGVLWAPNHVRNGAVVEFAKAQLTKSGALAPMWTISGPDNGLSYPIDGAIEP
jgi:hypothetical protein